MVFSVRSQDLKPAWWNHAHLVPERSLDVDLERYLAKCYCLAIPPSLMKLRFEERSHPEPCLQDLECH